MNRKVSNNDGDSVPAIVGINTDEICGEESLTQDEDEDSNKNSNNNKDNVNGEEQHQELDKQRVEEEKKRRRSTEIQTIPITVQGRVKKEIIMVRMSIIAIVI